MDDAPGKMHQDNSMLTECSARIIKIAINSFVPVALNKIWIFDVFYVSDIIFNPDMKKKIKDSRKIIQL